MASGEIKIEEFVNSDIVTEISNYFDKHPDSTLSEAKNALQDKFTYSQIKFVQKHTEFLEK
ncbi:MAG: helix-turn-helix domain-containing protein [Bacteroidales bacterium]|nr:helix-turn-helix domain-containing protein [Bacteroidales bacterium]